MGSIAGIVHIDNVVRDNRWQAGETGIAGVTLELLDDSGQVLANTQTDAAGHYRFDGVWPGVYAIREIQPASTFHAGEEIGSGGGQMATGRLEEIKVISGAELAGLRLREGNRRTRCESGRAQEGRHGQASLDPLDERRFDHDGFLSCTSRGFLVALRCYGDNTTKPFYLNCKCARARLVMKKFPGVSCPSSTCRRRYQCRTL
jgi:hypothetical protein